MFKYFIALSIILPIFIVSSIAYLKYNEVFGKTKQFELTTKSVLAADRSVPLNNLVFPFHLRSYSPISNHFANNNNSQ